MSIAEDRGSPVIDWRNAIGDFILAFGACEYWTHAYVRDFGPSVLQEAALSMETTARAALAKAIVLDKAVSPELKQRIEKVFGSLAALTKWRHLIAHNSPSFITPQRVTNQADAKMHLISFRKKGTSLTLQQLRRHALQAEALVSDMSALYLAVSPPHSGKPKAEFSDVKIGA